MRYFLSPLFFSFIFLASACQAQQPTVQLNMGNGKMVLLLDHSDGAGAVSQDQTDGFFDKITDGEISIQLNKTLEPGQDHAMHLAEYINYIKSDAMDFNLNELKFMITVLQKMYATVSAINPEILPDTLKLIKTKGRYYGDGVWYTRENCIIIPANDVENPGAETFIATLYHELFHIYSRLNPEKSAMLYKLIGFESIGYENLQVPEGLAERVLFNPDGVDFAQKISLKQQDTTSIDAIPIIYANSVGYNAAKKEFFGYLEFNIFQVQKQADDKWEVLVEEDGFSSTLSLKRQPDYFRQIRDNTGYIIHPDEVLADNFSFIMQDRDGLNVSQKFSPAGKQLLKDVEDIIKN